MGINKKCPKCGSTKVQLQIQKSKHALIWFILFGIWWGMWVMCKWCIGVMIWKFWDWWMALIKKSQDKGYVYKSAGWFSGQKRIYYCHNCGYNFKG
jgi:hypothetical protein